MIAVLFAALLTTSTQTVDQIPLPALDVFKGDLAPIIRVLLNAADAIQDKTAPPDGGNLKQYTYTEKETRTKLDSNGKSVDSDIHLYVVTRGVEPWEFYRKLVSVNGVAVSNEELAKQDREQKKREEKAREEWLRLVREAQKEAEKNKNRPQSAVNPTL